MVPYARPAVHAACRQRSEGNLARGADRGQRAATACGRTAGTPEVRNGAAAGACAPAGCTWPPRVGPPTRSRRCSICTSAISMRRAAEPCRSHSGAGWFKVEPSGAREAADPCDLPRGDWFKVEPSSRAEAEDPGRSSQRANGSRLNHTSAADAADPGRSSQGENGSTLNRPAHEKRRNFLPSPQRRMVQP